MRMAAIQGIRGSYSEEAALWFLGADAKILCCLSFEQTFEAVLSGETLYAILPLRNKIVGEIEKPVHLLKKHNLKIFDELALEIRHVLIGTNEAEFKELEIIESHAEALKQCHRFLSANEQIQAVEGNDTASSVQKIIEAKNPKRGAIGSCRAAEI
jgi:prephenate dehydratase